MSILPSAIPSLAAFSSGALTSRDACATFTGRPAKRSVKVRKCCRASSVVGTTTATCLPDMATAKAARSASLGLAEADIAADQPVHDLAGRQIVEHRRDGNQLVLGFLVWEPGRELVIGAGVDLDGVGS